MLKNFFKTVFRKFSRNKSYVVINIAGLSLGLTSAVILFLIIRHELSFDVHHSNKDSIYRVNTITAEQDGTNKTGASQQPLGAAIRTYFSGLKVTTVNYDEDGLFSITEDSEAPRKFHERSGLAFVEPEFFEMFDFSWIEGYPSLLKEPYRIALSKTLSEKFFPGGNALGKQIRLDNRYDLTVVGITEDPPVTTDFPFTAMVSYATKKAGGRDRNLDNWGATMSYVNTFVMVPESWDAGEFSTRLTEKTKSYMDQRHRDKRSYEAQSLSDIHFTPEYGSYTYTTAIANLWALGIIAFFLVATACINFINLATAQALNRAKETGVRKALGAGRRQLIISFIGETLVLTFMAGILCLLAVSALIPFVNDAFQFRLDPSALTEPSVVFFFAGLMIAVTSGSGIYPAAVLSGYKPALALKEQSSSPNSGGYRLRKGLVAFQFVIAQALMIGTLVVYRQMDLFHQTDMGFNRDAIITVQIPERDKTKMETLRNELRKEPGIEHVSFGLTSASSGLHWTTVMTYSEEKSPLKEIIADVRVGDEFYIPTYGITLLAGRNVSPSDTIHEIVVNEEFVSKMGLLSPYDAVGKTVRLYGERPVTIAGVVRNYNTSSLHDPVIPAFISPSVRSYQMMSVKINMSGASETIDNIRKAWSRLYPEYEFEHAFLDETIARFYEREQTVARLFILFSVIAITISCLGLFGLITFMVNRRTKEIGIRKVLGASVAHILALLGKEYVLLILAAFVIAAPLMYYVMTQWLGNFAYKIAIGADIFIFALVLTTIITIVTIGYRALRAATADPVRSLRYE